MDSYIGGPLRLTGRVQESAWGKVGRSSRISPMVPGHAEDARLAEFWIGGHHKAPSLLELPDGKKLPLDEALRRYPHALLGEGVVRRFGATLPFLLKILSVNGEYGLSIQLHPTKAKAEELHRRDPQHYPDENHKPEVGVAITPVSLLYGVKGRADLSRVLSALPGLRRFVGDGPLDRVMEGDGAGDVEAVKAVFATCFSLDAAETRACNEYLAQALPQAATLKAESALFARLGGTYGMEDPGLFAMVLMNEVHLAPGQAIFIGANVPHAYLEGDLIECMACSDNVVRAGLTPKYKDLETLLEVIDCSSSLEGVCNPVAGADGFQVVPTPTEDFCLRVLPDGASLTVIPSSEAPAVVICVGKRATITSCDTGRCVDLVDGGAALLPPHTGDYEVVTSEATLVHGTVG
jgi:mannose-6-phosphate isomerase